MSKYVILAFIISFWLILPIPFMFLNIGGYDTIDFTALEGIENPTIITYLATFIKMVSIYFQIIFLWVFGMPIYINVFLWILRAISGFILLDSLRGN